MIKKIPEGLLPKTKSSLMQTDETKSSREVSFDNRKISPSPSGSGSDSDVKIDMGNKLTHNLSDSDSPEPVSCWSSALSGCLMHNGSRFLNYLVSCLTSSGETRRLLNQPGSIQERKSDFKQGPFSETCTETVYSLTTYLLTFLSLITVSAGVTSASIESDIFEDMVPPAQSSARYLIPIGVFVYSFIFTLDRRPPLLLQLFLDINPVRKLIKQQRQPTRTEQKNIRQFAGLLYTAIMRNGPTHRWLYDKWGTMRVDAFNKQIEKCSSKLKKVKLREQKQNFSYDDDMQTLDIIFSDSKSTNESHLQKLYNMTFALIYAQKYNYLSPSFGPHLMNRNWLCRWGVRIFVTGAMMTTTMMSLNIAHSIDGAIKVNRYVAAAIIFIGPIPPGLLALWADLNTNPKFYLCDPDPATGLLRQICSVVRVAVRCGFFHNPDYLHIRNVVNLNMLGLTLGLLIAQPDSLDSSLLTYTAISFYAAKLFSYIPNLFRNALSQSFSNLFNQSVTEMSSAHSSHMESPVLEDVPDSNYKRLS